MVEIQYLSLFLVRYEALAIKFGSDWVWRHSLVYAEDFNHACERIREESGNHCPQNFENLTIF